MIPRPRFLSRPLALYHPSLQHLAVALRRAERKVELALDGRTYARARSPELLALRVKKHQSVLLRKLGPSAMRLQRNKVHNLRLVLDRLDGVLIRPGETFSYWQLVGRPTRARGFLPGMELYRGEPRAGIAGGICQSSNLIYWLVLHSPLEVVERYHHSFDPFPDQGRVLPYASGATVMYNYRDLRFHNPTAHTFQLRFWLDRKCLNGDLRVDGPLRFSYRVFERNHRFERRDGRVYRRNELWRRVIDKAQQATVRSEFLVENCGEVRYELSDGLLERREDVPDGPPEPRRDVADGPQEPRHDVPDGRPEPR